MRAFYYVLLAGLSPVWVGGLLELGRQVPHAAIAIFIIAVVLAAPILILLHFARRGK